MFKVVGAVLCSMLVLSVPIYAKDKDVKIAMKVEKTIAKLSRAHDKTPEKMVEYCKEIRREIEKKFGFKFYIKDYLDWACELIENECGKVFSKEDQIHLRRMFKAEPDSVYENIFQLHNDPDDMLMEKAASLNKGVKKPSNHTVLGVSIVLSGLYLCSTREPLYVYWGERMIASGIEVCKTVFTVPAEQKVL